MLRGIPEGTAIKDGNEILHESLIFQYRDQKSFSAFANFFRYKLLLEKGGWWVDTDTVVSSHSTFLVNMSFPPRRSTTRSWSTSSVVKAPQGAPAMSYAWSVCRSQQPENLVWGEVGPRLMAESVKKLSLQRFVMSPRMFCPIDYLEWEAVLNPASVWDFTDEVHAVHFWNEMWRHTKRDKNRAYRRLPVRAAEAPPSGLTGDGRKAIREAACAEQPTCVRLLH